jgi:hypothetical protein
MLPHVPLACQQAPGRDANEWIAARLAEAPPLSSRQRDVITAAFAAPEIPQFPADADRAA